MSDQNWITPEKPVYVLCNPPEEGRPTWGLLRGQGSPSLAHLQAVDHWVVVKVISYRNVDLRGERCVEFEDHEILFEGRRSEAIDTLIGLGADPAEISPPIQIKPKTRPLRKPAASAPLSSSCGRLRRYRRLRLCRDRRSWHRAHRRRWLCQSGPRRPGDCPRQALRNGGSRRSRHHDWRRTIQVSGSVGNGGVAIAANGKVRIGNQAVGIVRSGEWVSGGQECIAIGEVVSGGPDSLLIAKRWEHDPETGTSKTHIACGVVGRDGIEPGGGNIRPWMVICIKFKEASDE